MREDDDFRGQVSTLKVTLTPGQCSECLTYSPALLPAQNFV